MGLGSAAPLHSGHDLPPGKPQHLTTPEASAHPRSATASESTRGPVEVVNTLLARGAGALLLL